MARLVRDTVGQYYPVIVQLYVNDSLVGPSATFTLPDESRSMSLSVQVVNRGGVNQGVKTKPATVSWKLIPTYGCDNFKFLSPNSPSTFVEIVNAQDTGVIEVTIATQFESITKRYTMERV